MHQHAALTAMAWVVSRAEQDAFAVDSHLKLAAAQHRGFFDDLVVPHRGLGRDNNVRPDTTVERLAALPPVAGTDPRAGLIADTSAPLSDGASVVLLASDAWASSRGLPVLAYLTWCRTAAVGCVHGAEGLLTAPAYAVAAMLSRAGLTLPDFALNEINEAYAFQVLATLEAWEDSTFCAERLGCADTWQGRRLGRRLVGQSRTTRVAPVLRIHRMAPLS